MLGVDAKFPFAKEPLFGLADSISDCFSFSHAVSLAWGGRTSADLPPPVLWKYFWLAAEGCRTVLTADLR